MSQAGSYILGLVHDRTKAKCLHKIDAKNYNGWVKLWFATAEEMVKEFEDEGLLTTAEALRNEIEWQKRYVSP